MPAAERGGKIAEHAILPVLEAFRRTGMTVVHAPSPAIAEKYGEFMRYSDPMPPSLARRIDANATRHSSESGEPEPTATWPPAGKGLLSRFCATIREIRDFNREIYGTNRESVCINRVCRAARRRCWLRTHQGKGLLSRFCATVREIRDFCREIDGTNRESVCINRSRGLSSTTRLPRSG
eukprot:SAG31_NODE_5677_length_2388_cov_16.564875_3_plen_180_part_00